MGVGQVAQVSPIASRTIGHPPSMFPEGWALACGDVITETFYICYTGCMEFGISYFLVRFFEQLCVRDCFIIYFS